MTRHGRMLFAALLCAVAPAPLVAQDEVPCVGGACALGLRAAQSTLGAILLAAGGGNPWLGSSSTLGFRTVTFPRIGVQVRTGFAGGDVPALEPGELEGFSALSLSGGFDMSILDGWAPAATVGGMGSVDVFGHAGAVFLPDDAAFTGSPFVWSLGARIGIFRESFTLPGITASLAYAGVGAVDFDRAAVLRRQAGFSWNSAHAWQARAVVGKRVAALALAGGFGWDGAVADVAAASRTAGGVSVTDERTIDPDRWQVFAGVTWTSLILSLTAEAGWQIGPESIFMVDRDPAASGRLFGALGARLTF